MSTDPHRQAVPLDLILGPHLAATVIRRTADALQREDLLPETVALRLACERATDGDPLVLAAPGQIWELRADVDPDDAPARRLAIHLRLTSPPTVYVSDPDDPAGDDAAIDELLLEVLDLYTLASWDEHFLAPDPVA
ncbi:hypothetical protein GCM10009759_70950 [Kitasatospora saccharophila]|uniref:Uncharacterized protein n=1 Tax=Kitasatospora saccharophila TaxID=407973 RepID=A0ABN2Y2U8_9ACTN